MALIITVANQKGGAGKTTVAMHVGGILAQRGRRTLIVDADPQGTAYRWAASAEESFPAAVVQMSADGGGMVHRQVVRFHDDYEWIVVDTPPAVDSNAARSALLVSDLALIPVIPSPPDLWASLHIKAAVEAATVTNEALKAFLLINQLKSGTSLGRQVEDLLRQFDLPLLDSALGDREVYRHAAAYGQTALGMGNPSANVELEALVDEIEAIGGGVRE